MLNTSSHFLDTNIFLSLFSDNYSKWEAKFKPKTGITTNNIEIKTLNIVYILGAQCDNLRRKIFQVVDALNI
jgi:hypothetical protein